MRARCVAVSLILWTSVCSAQDINGDLNAISKTAPWTATMRQRLITIMLLGLVVLPPWVQQWPQLSWVVAAMTVALYLLVVASS